MSYEQVGDNIFGLRDVGSSYSGRGLQTDTLSTGHGQLNVAVDTNTITINNQNKLTLAPITADVDINTHKLINVTNPTNFQDAATKDYVDANTSALNAGTNLVKIGSVMSTVASPVFTQVTSSNSYICKNDTSSGGNPHFSYATNAGSQRWNTGLLGVESSGLLGSDFAIWRYDNTGTYAGNPFLISRNTGNITVGNDLILNSKSFISFMNSEIKNRIVVIAVGGTFTINNGFTGVTTTSTADANTTFASIFAMFTSGRTWVETLVLYGAFTLLSSDSIQIPSYTEIIVNARVFLPSNPSLSQKLFYFNGVTQASIKGGYYYNGGYTNGETGGEDSGVLYVSNSASDILIENCIINGFAGGGLTLRGSSTFLTVRGCHIKNVAVRGVWLVAVNKATVTDCFIENCGRGATLGGNGDGIDIDGFSQKVIASHCHVDTTGRCGIHVEEAASDVLVTHNRITGAAFEGIKLECVATNTSTTEITVLGNNISGCSYGMTIKSTHAAAGILQKVQVSQNLAYNNANVGFYLGDYLTDVTVNACKAHNNAIGFWIDNYTNRFNVQCINNIATNNTTDYTLSNTTAVLMVGNTDSTSIASAAGLTLTNANATVGGKLNVTGLNLNSTKINNVMDPTSAQDAATKAYVDTTSGGIIAGTGLTKTGVTLSVNTSQTQITAVGNLTALTLGGNLNANTNKLVNVVDPTNAQEAATKNYVDNQTVLAGTNLTKTGVTINTVSNPTFTGVTTVSSAVDSTSVGSGAAVVTGGASIGKNLFLGGPTLNVAGFDTPVFENGSITGGTTMVIPTHFLSGSWNVMEVKIRYNVNTSSVNVLLTGNTATNGSGTAIGVLQNAETTTKATLPASPIFTNTSGTAFISQTNETGFDSILSIKVCKGVASVHTHYFFDNVYTWALVSAARVAGFGYLNSMSVGSLILTPSAGTITGTWSTVHSL